VLVPAGEVLKNPIINYTTRGMRRTTLEVGVGYRADLVKTRELLLDAVSSVDGVRERPEPEVWVEELGESSVNLSVRFWHAPDIATKWRVRSEVAISVKETLDDAGIEIPFPQRVVTVVPAEDS
jgi:small conductance mechanosensitive channel